MTVVHAEAVVGQQLSDARLSPSECASICGATRLVLRDPTIANSPEIALTHTLTPLQDGNGTDDDDCEDSEHSSQRHASEA